MATRTAHVTRRYIDGQRARYVAPFAIFLFNISSWSSAFHCWSAAATWRTAALGIARTVAGPLYLLLGRLITLH
jgi:hypothetical protein